MQVVQPEKLQWSCSWGAAAAEIDADGTAAVVSCGWSSNGGELQMEQQRW